MRIRFATDLTPSEAALHLSKAVHAGTEQSGLPFESREGSWWELSSPGPSAADGSPHKMDVLGAGDYAVRCRGADPELEALFRETITTFGGTFA